MLAKGNIAKTTGIVNSGVACSCMLVLWNCLLGLDVCNCVSSLKAVW